MNQYRRAFDQQKSGAAQRGIEFKLTFEEWLAWWGDDIDKRGTGRNDLSMQRIGDQGAYELGSIKNGTPLQNMVTMGLQRRTRNTLRLAEIHEARLDMMMSEESAEPEDELTEDEQELAELGIKSSYSRRYSFMFDKDI